MTHLGKLFHDLRQSKHISLRQAAGDICSATQVSRFENGLPEITASKLFALLENIHISLAEFSSLMDNRSAHGVFLKQINDSRETLDITGLKNFISQKKNQ